MSLTRSIRQGVYANGFVQLSIAFVQILSVPFLIEKWGADKYGVWIILSTIPSYIVFLDFGFLTAGGNKMTMASGAKQHAYCGELFFELLQFITISTFIVLCSLSLIYYIYPDLKILDGVSISLVAPILCLGLLSLYSNWIQTGFRAAGNFPRGIVITGYTSIAEAAAIMMAASISDDLLIAACAQLITRFAGVTYSVINLNKLPSRPKYQGNFAKFKLLRDISGSSFAFLPLGVAQAGYLQGTIFIVGMAFGPTTAAYLNSTRTLARVGVQVVTMFSNAVMPAMSMTVGAGDVKTTIRLYKGMLKFGLVASVLYFVGAAIFYEAVYKIWTKNAFSYDHSVTMIVIGACSAQMFWHPISNLMLSVNHQASYSFLYLIFSALALVVIYKWGGTNGAIIGAISMLAVDLAMVFLIIPISNKCFHGRLM